jgi:hypothetical protein
MQDGKNGHLTSKDDIRRRSKQDAAAPDGTPGLKMRKEGALTTLDPIRSFATLPASLP